LDIRFKNRSWRIAGEATFQLFQRPGEIRDRPTPLCSFAQVRGISLWDSISLIDDAAITLINGFGGLRAIAISHPHFYTTSPPDLKPPFDPLTMHTPKSIYCIILQSKMITVHVAVAEPSRSLPWEFRR